MASVRKKLAQAIERLGTYDPGERSTLQATRARETFTLLFELLEKEQEFRRTLIFKRLQTPGSLSETSDCALAAHKRWCARIIDTANALANQDYHTRQEGDVLSAILQRANDELLRNKRLFVTKPRDSLVARVFYTLYTGYKKWQTKRANRRRYELAGLDLQVGKIAEDLYLDFKSIKSQYIPAEKMSDLDAFAAPGAPIGNNSAIAVIPENAGVNGCVNRSCHGGFVYGARWGSEDYPCPKCNEKKYDEWVAQNHPEEVSSDKIGMSKAEATAEKT